MSEVSALFTRARQCRIAAAANDAPRREMPEGLPIPAIPEDYPAPDEDGTPSKGNLAYRLGTWASHKYDIISTLDGRTYAVPKGGGLVGVATDSAAYESALVGVARRNLQAPSTSTVKDAIRSQIMGEQITQQATFGRVLYYNPAMQRAARTPDGFAVLLGRPTRGGDARHVVQITPDGWGYITHKHPDVGGLLFAPHAHALPMPLPTTGGQTLDALWEVCNIAEADRVFVAAWLLAAMMPGEPCPILELTGGQGSGKSTTQAALRNVVDPVNGALRAPPKNEDDLIAAAAGNWVLSFENVSHLTDGMQDALCRVVTGGAYAKRALYTDSTEHLVTVQRPIILNAIAPVLTRPDAVDRTIRVVLPRRSNTVSAASLEASFKRSQGAVLGGLLDLFAAVLAKLPSIHIPPAKQPRMIEYARLCMAVAEVWGQDSESVLDGLLARRKAADSDTVEGSPVIGALLELMRRHSEDVVEYGSSELRAQLASYRPDHTQGWPQSDRGMADALARYTEPLRRLGVQAERARRGSVRGWKFTKTPEFG